MTPGARIIMSICQSQVGKGLCQSQVDIIEYVYLIENKGLRYKHSPERG